MQFSPGPLLSVHGVNCSLENIDLHPTDFLLIEKGIPWIPQDVRRLKGLQTEIL